MKKVFISLLSMVLVFNLIFLSTATADSPVTSTPFSNAYLDIEMVEKARLTDGVINEEICHFLASPGYSLDVKAAVINSIYNYSNVWSVKNNAAIYTGYMHQSNPSELNLNSLPAEELLVIGYLVLLDDYIQPEKALPFLELAQDLAPDNFTIAMIQVLARAQKLVFTTGEGSIWSLIKKVVSNPMLTKDRLRDEALFIILEYLCCSQGDITIFINNNLHISEEIDPVIIEGRTLVHWGELFKAIGAEAEWDEIKKQIVAKKGNTTLTLQLNQANVEVNGKVTATDQPPIMLHGQLMVPLRFVSETLGAKVHWDKAMKLVEVELKEPAWNGF